MTKDYFKRASEKNYTAWDLNCPSVVFHNPYRNKFEKRIRRSARRVDKQNLKKMLDK